MRRLLRWLAGLFGPRGERAAPACGNPRCEGGKVLTRVAGHYRPSWVKCPACAGRGVTGSAGETPAAGRGEG